VKDVIDVSGELQSIDVEFDLIRANNEAAEKNQKLLRSRSIRAFDVMGSVGSGKTALIEQMVQILKGKYRVAVINGDLTTTIDADRVGRHGVHVIQINTGKECHLDANIVRKGLEKVNLNQANLVFIENVGNLICPADFQLGTEKRIVVISVTEGPYVAVKHPVTFLNTDIAVINKIDLAELMDVNVDKLEKELTRIKPSLKVFKTNCKTGQGVDAIVKALNL